MHHLFHLSNIIVPSWGAEVKSEMTLLAYSLRWHDQHAGARSLFGLSVVTSSTRWISERRFSKRQ